MDPYTTLRDTFLPTAKNLTTTDKYEVFVQGWIATEFTEPQEQQEESKGKSRNGPRKYISSGTNLIALSSSWDRNLNTGYKNQMATLLTNWKGRMRNGGSGTSRSFWYKKILNHDEDEYFGHNLIRVDIRDTTTIFNSLVAGLDALFFVCYFHSFIQ